MPLILGANSASGGYSIKNSVRFNNASSDELARTNGTATDGKKCTISFWIKKCRIEGSTTTMRFMQAYSGTGNQFHSQWGDGSTSPGDQWNISPGEQGGNEGIRMTNATYRDPSAWYHYLWYWDSVSQLSTLYVNGVEQSSSLTTAVVLNQITSATKSGTSFRIKSSISGQAEFYLAEFYIIDGQALTPSSFGETDTLTGIWKPKAYTGTFGTNGVYLDFEDSSNLGNDMSGNNNDFTVTNLTSVDQSTDTPTNNFATWNPLYVPDTARANTYSDGNLKAGNVLIGNWITTFANFSPSQGKWYWEIKPKSLNTTLALGIYFGQYTTTGSYPFDTNVFGCHQNGLIYYNSSTYSYMASYTSDDIVTFALDMDNKKFYMGKNGSWANGSGSTNQTFANAVSITDDIPASFPTGKDVFPILTAYDAFGEANFGSPMYAGGSYTDAAGFGNFSYAVPSGYYSLCTKNLANFG